jgi:uncharacterized protein (DUF1800 family)
MSGLADGWGSLRGVRSRLGVGLTALVLAACGGGGGGGGSDSGLEGPTSQTNASRFAGQATFGANDATIAAVSSSGYTAWLNEQFAKPQTLHRTYMDQVTATLPMGSTVNQNNFLESFWKQAVTGEDQLRQRVAFALSQIFVVSFVDGSVSNYPRGVACYYDMLGENAFGNFRDLLEDVTLHPMMGIYLSHMRNQKEDLASGRVPDENYAREVMQLFSIGLVQLNNDGTRKLQNGQPIDAYTGEDIKGLAKVFTGWSWYAGPTAADRTRNRFFGGDANPERDCQPMQSYNRQGPTPTTANYHSITEKRFLGVTIPPQTLETAAPEADLRIALDTLFNHPNVGPFISKQLIQRLVTSNPSPAYVARVAAKFNSSGGKRGDMKAVISAILLDPEARDIDSMNLGAGRLREPVLRLGNFLRAFQATSTSGFFRGINSTDDPATSLSQSPMRSGSVFNFYRPGYTPPGTTIAQDGMVAPEFQITHEVSVAGYLNYMRNWVSANSGRDIQPNFFTDRAVADDVVRLVERMNLLLMGGQMPVDLRAKIELAVGGRVVPAPTTDSAGVVTNQAAIDTARLDRVRIAALLTMSAPDYLAQK